MIDGAIIHGTYSNRAPKVTMNPARFLFRDCTLFLVLKIFLFFFIAGTLIVIYWSKIFGGILVALALLVAVSIWRCLSLRKVEFNHAVLTPGIVISQNPPTLLILANMACDGQDAPIWAVKMEDCRSLEPLSSEIGTRIPCVTAFQGSGFGGSWERMVSNPLTSGTGSTKVLNDALSRLNDEEEWRVLNDAVTKKKIPKIGQTLRL